MIPTIFEKKLMCAASALHQPESCVATLVSAYDSIKRPLVAYKFGEHAVVSDETPERVLHEICGLANLPYTHQLVYSLATDTEALGRVEYHTVGVKELARLDDSRCRRDIGWAAEMLITARYADQQERNAMHDPLTGLYNRRALMDQLQRELERARRSADGKATVAILLIDLDKLKFINDNFGHEAGDRALTLIGQILEATARRMDLAARYAGDEFIMLVPNVTAEEAIDLAERIRRAVSAVQLPYGPLTISMGIALAPRDASEAEALVRIADQALYRAKVGRDCVRIALPI